MVGAQQRRENGLQRRTVRVAVVTSALPPASRFDGCRACAASLRTRSDPCLPEIRILNGSSDQQLATPALRNAQYGAPRAAAFEQPENARIKLPRGRTSTDFEAEKCAEMLSLIAKSPRCRERGCD